MQVSWKEYVPDDFYDWMDNIYKMTGLFPPKSIKLRVVYLLIALPNIFLCTFLLVFLEWVDFFLTFGHDFKSSMLNLGIATLGTIVVFRIVMWFFTKKRLGEIKIIVKRRTFSFECFSVEKIIYGNVLKAAAKQRRAGDIIISYADISKMWSRAEVVLNENRNKVDAFREETMLQTRMLCCALFIFLTITCVFVISTSYINTLIFITPYEEFNPKLNKTSTYRTYPFHTFFPFDTSLSDGYFWLGFFYQLYAFCGNLQIFLPIITIVTNSIIHLIAQTMVVQEALRHVDQNIDSSQSAEAILLIKEMRIVKCVSELQDIYRALYLLEELYNVELLIQYGSAIFILCTLAYVVPLLNNAGELICITVSLVAVLGETFLFTYCCQTLSLELQNVVISIHDLDWTNYSFKMKKNVLFLLCRSQKQTILTAGKIFNLDLLFFIQIVQKSYSFYTLISKSNTKNDE